MTGVQTCALPIFLPYREKADLLKAVTEELGQFQLPANGRDRERENLEEVVAKARTPGVPPTQASLDDYRDP